MNVLEYELAYYDSAAHRFNHYTTRTPQCSWGSFKIKVKYEIICHGILGIVETIGFICWMKWGFDTHLELMKKSCIMLAFFLYFFRWFLYSYINYFILFSFWFEMFLCFFMCFFVFTSLFLFFTATFFCFVLLFVCFPFVPVTFFFIIKMLLEICFLFSY